MTTVYSTTIAAACTIYCEGPVLNAIQLSGIFPDSKTFVDMPMRYAPNVTLQAFYDLSDQTNKTVLEKYLEDYFLSTSSDLDDWVPTDFTHTPAFLDTITDADYKKWGSDLNELWLVLGRQVNASVHEHPERHSFLPRNHSMIVPGGRFRESYYWDSWWIIRGLLVCDMSDTAKDVISNLIDDIYNFGFVPNGGRIYYLDRSQPPLLSEMLRTYYEYMLNNGGATAEVKDFISNGYLSVLREYSFWMRDNNQMVELTQGAGSPTYLLNRFYSNYTTPRPESYATDYENAILSGRPPAEYYRQVRAGAESGWDFSSRWMRPAHGDQFNLTNIHTNEVVPIDLNAILYKVELNLAYFANILSQWSAENGDTYSEDGYADQATAWTDAARVRAEAINTFMWDAQNKHWRDFNLTSQTFTHYTAQDAQYAAASAPAAGVHSESAAASHTTTPSAASSAASSATSNAATATPAYSVIAYWVPLWAGLSPPDSTTGDQLVSSLQASGLLQAAGVLTTTASTGQQWDSPEAWAPEVMFTIEGLQKLNTANSLSLASDISAKWLNTNFLAFNRTHYMYEKYNAFEVGVGGGGGEYVPQIGFGWSNGVALLLLQQTFAPAQPSSHSSSGITEPEKIVVIFICVFAFLAVAVLVFLHCYMPKKAAAGTTSTTSPSVPMSDSPIHSSAV